MNKHNGLFAHTPAAAGHPIRAGREPDAQKDGFVRGGRHGLQHAGNPVPRQDTLDDGGARRALPDAAGIHRPPQAALAAVETQRGGGCGRHPRGVGRGAARQPDSRLGRLGLFRAAAQSLGSDLSALFGLLAVSVIRRMRCDAQVRRCRTKKAPGLRRPCRPARRSRGSRRRQW